MNRLNAKHVAVVAVASLAGCATGTPARQSLTVSQQASDVGPRSQPTDEQVAFGMMAAVAIRQSRFMTSTKSVGLFQGNDTRAPMYPIINVVLDNNRYQEIHAGEVTFVCTPKPPGPRGAPPPPPTCGFDVVDVLMQITSVQIVRDTGYVGGYLTDVMPNQTRPIATPYCFLAVQRDGVWYDLKSVEVKEPRHCTADRRR